MKFRFHRGGLEDSMKTQVEFKSLDELKGIIDNWLTVRKSNSVELRFEYRGFDERISQETYYVIVRDSPDYIVGMTDCDPTNPAP